MRMFKIGVSKKVFYSQKLKCIILFSAFLFVVLSTYNLSQSMEYTYSHTNISGVCVVPDLNAFDKEIMKHVFTPDQIQCSQGINLVYFTMKGNLTLNKTAARHLEGVKCSYQKVKWINDNDIEHGEAEVLLDHVYVPADLCYVTCTIKSKVIWERYLTNIDSRSVLFSKHIRNESESDLSILVFGIDSTSRLAAIRHLPKTLSYLQSTLKADDFKGHTVIGENTYANMIPFLTGKFTYELELNSSDTFDKIPIIWNDFKNMGYATYYAEDFPRFNLFNYNGNGFKEKPVDHYMRPFYLSLEKQNKLKRYLEIVHMKAEAMNIKLTSNSIFCYQNQARHNILLENLKHFFHSYNRKLKFALGYLVEVSHEVPSFLSLVDEDILQFFTWLNDNGHLENTIVFFIGDHGPRIDSVRNTVVGRIEVIMPLLFLYIPKHLKEKYNVLNENIKANTKILTTHTDSYKTMKDILNKNFDSTQQITFDSDSKGISLFKRINPSRTCSDMKIPEFVCPCYTSHKLSSTDPKVVVTAKFIVSNINKKLKNISNICHFFKLQKVENAEEIINGIVKTRVNNFRLREYFISKETICKRLRLLLSVNIKEAMFEAMVDVCKDELKLIGKITRNNKYGLQSKCIDNIDLKPFCICI